VTNRPPYDPWLLDLHKAMLIGIAENLKIEYPPLNNLTPELMDVLRRLEEKKDKQK
jgi:hypothetical protein